ncbi:hypothetical protein C8R43DRAFT_1063017 [Mycena crocata]|nr:hypothetical protein C8R43DRAFT_1063017 [Mycena crocata]
MPAESCNDTNECRKLFDIIWGCLATIFACTWVSVHPNVPPPNQSRLALFWRRLRLMLVAVIAPEFMVGLAARQFFAARSFARDFKVSRTHGFFICMGGFVSRTGHHPVVIQEQLDTIPEYLADIHAVEEEDIKDKSKGDALSKGVALIQGLWFTTQCLARFHQRLPVSGLEIATLAFAVVNIFIYALWWGKPLDVQRPIIIGPKEEIPTTDSPLLDAQNPSALGSGEQPPDAAAKSWGGSFFGGLWGALGGDYGNDYSPTSYTSVPSFWSTASTDDRDKNKSAFYIVCLVGTIFGGIHFAAWDADFPSTKEMWMWKLSALAVVAVPVVYQILWSIQIVDDGPALDTDVMEVLIPSLLGFFIYPIARLFLIVLPLIALRDLPPGAFTDVNWSIYIPHL